MALTREIELKLDSAGLIAYFDDNAVAWQAAAQDAHTTRRDCRECGNLMV